MSRAILALLFTAACNTGTSDGDDTDATDTDVADVTCTALPEGGWLVNGACIGMDMTGTLTLDQSGCGFEFSAWSMMMDMPKGGKVDGDTVTLTGAGWTDCTGTIVDGVVDGTCSDGCAFHMEVN